MTLLLALLAFQIPPTPATAVNDYAHILPESSRAAIEDQLRQTQVVVAIFPSLEGEDVDQITDDVFRKWGVGQKGKNDGVLLTLFVQDRRWRIEVGYGAEEVLTDAQAAQVGREELVPHLRAGDWAGGVQATTKRILDILNRRAPAPAVARYRRHGSPPGIGLIWILVVVVMSVVSGLARRRRGMLGGRGFSALPWWWWFGGGGGGGWGGGGGGWGGGSGNFGGGDSGGGGASGSW